MSSKGRPSSDADFSDDESPTMLRDSPLVQQRLEDMKTMVPDGNRVVDQEALRKAFEQQQKMPKGGANVVTPDLKNTAHPQAGNTRISRRPDLDDQDPDATRVATKHVALDPHDSTQPGHRSGGTKPSERNAPRPSRPMQPAARPSAPHQAAGQVHTVDGPPGGEAQAHPAAPPPSVHTQLGAPGQLENNRGFAVGGRTMVPGQLQQASGPGPKPTFSPAALVAPNPLDPVVRGTGSAGSGAASAHPSMADDNDIDATFIKSSLGDVAPELRSSESLLRAGSTNWLVIVYVVVAIAGALCVIFASELAQFIAWLGNLVSGS